MVIIPLDFPKWNRSGSVFALAGVTWEWPAPDGHKHPYSTCILVGQVCISELKTGFKIPWKENSFHIDSP